MNQGRNIYLVHILQEKIHKVPVRKQDKSSALPDLLLKIYHINLAMRLSIYFSSRNSMIENSPRQGVRRDRTRGRRRPSRCRPAWAGWCECWGVGAPGATRTGRSSPGRLHPGWMADCMAAAQSQPHSTQACTATFMIANSQSSRGMDDFPSYNWVPSLSIRSILKPFFSTVCPLITFMNYHELITGCKDGTNYLFQLQIHGTQTHSSRSMRCRMKSPWPSKRYRRRAVRCSSNLYLNRTNKSSH